MAVVYAPYNDFVRGTPIYLGWTSAETTTTNRLRNVAAVLGQGSGAGTGYYAFGGDTYIDEFYLFNVVMEYSEDGHDAWDPDDIRNLSGTRRTWFPSADAYNAYTIGVDQAYGGYPPPDGHTIRYQSNPPFSFHNAITPLVDNVYGPIPLLDDDLITTEEGPGQWTHPDTGRIYSSDGPSVDWTGGGFDYGGFEQYSPVWAYWGAGWSSTTPPFYPPLYTDTSELPQDGLPPWGNFLPKNIQVRCGLRLKTIRGVDVAFYHFWIHNVSGSTQSVAFRFKTQPGFDLINWKLNGELYSAVEASVPAGDHAIVECPNLAEWFNGGGSYYDEGSPLIHLPNSFLMQAAAGFPEPETIGLLSWNSSRGAFHGDPNPEDGTSPFFEWPYTELAAGETIEYCLEIGPPRGNRGINIGLVSEY